MIKTAQNQMLAVQKLLTLEKSDDDELSQDLNTIEVKFSAENKITQWWRWLIGDSTGGVADVEPSMAFFIQHPWLSTIFFGYQIRYWSKWLFPLWSDRDLEIYTVLSTLYAYNGRERIAAIYDAIYKNDFSRDTLDISSMKASITFIHEKVTDINRKKYLQNELFLYALCNLCLEIDSKKVRVVIWGPILRSI